MEYLHQSTYGHAGGYHTARLVMAIDRSKGHVYDLKGSRPDLTKPIYVIRGDHSYSTEHHPAGESPHAMFEIRGDKVHTTAFHPQHNSVAHIFEVRQ